MGGPRGPRANEGQRGSATEGAQTCRPSTQDSRESFSGHLRRRSSDHLVDPFSLKTLRTRSASSYFRVTINSVLRGETFSSPLKVNLQGVINGKFQVNPNQRFVGDYNG